MEEIQQRTEWVIFEKSNQDYFFLLDEESLKKIRQHKRKNKKRINTKSSNRRWT